MTGRSSDIVAKARLGPLAAVTLVESLPPAQGLGQGVPANTARIYLAKELGQPPEQRWKVRWAHITAQLPLDE
jgi:hypothetical protein